VTNAAHRDQPGGTGERRKRATQHDDGVGRVSDSDLGDGIAINHTLIPNGHVTCTG
jgi:hypothetical protein